MPLNSHLHATDWRSFMSKIHTLQHATMPDHDAYLSQFTARTSIPLKVSMQLI